MGSESIAQKAEGRMGYWILIKQYICVICLKLNYLNLKKQ